MRQRPVCAVRTVPMNHKEQKTLPNNDVIAGVITALETVPRVILPVRGTSMLPFIIGDLDSVELVKPLLIEVGDVILAWINGSHYVIHRVIKTDGDNLQLMGDGNLGGDERCKVSDVVAKAEYVVHSNGKRKYLYSPGMVRASRLWWMIKPLRRWILAIYRRTVLKYKLIHKGH